MENRDFKNGDYVIYGGKGLCVIKDIRTVEFEPGSAQPYFILSSVLTPSLTYYVPRKNELLCAKLRPLPTKEEAEAVLDFSRGKYADWPEDKKARTCAFREILSGGDEKELLALLNCLELKRAEFEEEGRKLSNSDEMTRKTVSRALREEFSRSLQMDPDEAEIYIRLKLC